MTSSQKPNWWLKIVAISAFLVGVAGALGQGNYAPVVAEDLKGAAFNYYFDANMKAVSPPDFSWSFTGTNLTVKAGAGAIPADLVNQLAAGAKDVKLIEAAWKIEAGELVISDIKLNGKAVTVVVKLHAYRTAPTLIRIGKHQYVFTVTKKPSAVRRCALAERYATLVWSNAVSSVRPRGVL